MLKSLSITLVLLALVARIDSQCTGQSLSRTGVYSLETSNCNIILLLLPIKAKSRNSKNIIFSQALNTP